MSTLLRQAARVAATPSRARLFSSSTARKDIVQDLYLREIKSYKPPPVVKDAHVGVVKTFSTPSRPSPPKLPVDLAGELSAYDLTDVTLAETDVKATDATAELGAGADAFLEVLEQDIVKPEAHHH